MRYFKVKKMGKIVVIETLLTSKEVKEYLDINTENEELKQFSSSDVEKMTEADSEMLRTKKDIEFVTITQEMLTYAQCKDGEALTDPENLEDEEE